MAILNSVFRSMDHQIGCLDQENRHYGAVIGIDVPTNRNREALFQNFLSTIPIHENAKDFIDRDEGCRFLSEQFQSALRDGVDLGILSMMSVFGRRPRVQHWAIEYFLRHACSLWYGFFGESKLLNAGFLGNRIRELRFFGPTWPPMGLTLIVNKHHERLFFNVTYDKNCLEETNVRSFLDFLIGDLDY